MLSGRPCSMNLDIRKEKKIKAKKKIIKLRKQRQLDWQEYSENLDFYNFETYQNYLKLGHTKMLHEHLSEI